MKTAKFRLLKRDKYWYIQLHHIFGWKTYGKTHGSNGGSTWIEESFKSKKDALKALPKTIKTRKELVNFIQYPTIRIF
jgi:hypothetical protein